MCALFAFIFADAGSTLDLAVWIGLGLATLMVRGFLYYVAPHALPGDNPATRQRRFLWLCSGASGLSGLMFAWGWLVFAPALSRNEFAGLAFANIAVLFAGLYAYGIFLPTFLAFLLTSVPAGVVAVYLHHRPTDEWLVSTLGLLALGGVALLYAMQAAANFRINQELQSRIYCLLEELTSKRDEAIRATLAKSRFLAAASHDLRQPMHAINLYLASLEDGFEKHLSMPVEIRPVESMRQVIGNLKDSTSYLNTMFESLLDISRLDAGAIAVEIRPTPINRLLQKLTNEFSELARLEGLEFEVCLPPRFNWMEVETDTGLLERLLRNLLSNALRYTETGGFRLSVVATDQAVDFRVVDTGPGIPAGMRNRVFEEFFQVPGMPARSENAGSGLGLGLAISARLAEKLGARLRVSSHRRLGSVFAIRQPMRIGTQAPDTESRFEKPRPTPFDPETLIAVIDDDAEIRGSTRLVLENLGASVFTAESGELAVQQLGTQGREPQLILCDYRLAGANGIETIARLREEFNREIPAILITGETSAADMAAFRDSPLRVLYKPLSGDQLLTAIRQELVSVSQPVPESPGAEQPARLGYD